MVHWESEAKRLLKSELKRQDVTYVDLVEKLAAIGVKDNKSAIANRISRGRFSLVFFLQCMRAIGVDEVRLSRGRKGG